MSSPNRTISFKKHDSKQSDETVADELELNYMSVVRPEANKSAYILEMNHNSICQKLQRKAQVNLFKRQQLLNLKNIELTTSDVKNELTSMKSVTYISESEATVYHQANNALFTCFGGEKSVLGSPCR